MKFNPYSFSKLESWVGCPHRFKLNYIEKIKLPFEQNVALLRGSYFHHYIETNSEDFELTEIFTESIKIECNRILNVFLNSDVAKKHLERKGQHEEKFAFNHKLEIVDYNDKTAWLRGAVDYHYIIDNVLTLVDWKSGKYKEPQFQSDKQAKLYALFYFLKYPEINEIKASFVYIEHLKENTFTYQRSQLTSIIKEFFNNTKFIELDEEFRKKPSVLCDYCGFKQFGYCDAQVELSLQSLGSW
jgi:CRISPR/Cas system-associated exonuclease Cas4 (RecB family)